MVVTDRLGGGSGGGRLGEDEVAVVLVHRTRRRGHGHGQPDIERSTQRSIHGQSRMGGRKMLGGLADYIRWRAYDVFIRSYDRRRPLPPSLPSQPCPTLTPHSSLPHSPALGAVLVELDAGPAVGARVVAVGLDLRLAPRRLAAELAAARHQPARPPRTGGEQSDRTTRGRSHLLHLLRGAYHPHDLHLLPLYSLPTHLQRIWST